VPVCAFLVAVVAAGLVGTFALYRGLEGDPAYEAFYWGTAFLAVFAVAHAGVSAHGDRGACQ
jgi:hypothetical protein